MNLKNLKMRLKLGEFFWISCQNVSNETFVELYSWWNWGFCRLQVAPELVAKYVRRNIWTSEFDHMSPISTCQVIFLGVFPSYSTKPIGTNCEILVGPFFGSKHSRLPGLKFLQGLCFRFEFLPFRLGRLEKPRHQCSSGQFRCQCSQTLEGYDWNLTSSLLQRAHQQKDTKKKRDMSITNEKTWRIMMQLNAGASLVALAFAFALAFALAAACSESESDEIWPFLRLSAWGR